MSRGKLMKHMGQLWLAAEVQNLESRVQQSHTAFSPYLVLDVDALINYTHLAKQLVSARKFIVLIPVTGKFKKNGVLQDILNFNRN